MKKCLFVLGFLLPFFVEAQSTFPCSSFCVTEVTLDSANGTWNVNINFEGTTNDFINYPYVSMMIAASGDTVALGQMEYFGQIGGTSQVYHPNAYAETFTAGQIFFVYDQDTCQLNFPCDNVGYYGIEKLPWSVSTLSDGWGFNSSSKVNEVVLFDIHGAQVGRWNQVCFIPNASLSTGIYIYKAKVGSEIISGHLIRE